MRKIKTITVRIVLSLALVTAFVSSLQPMATLAAGNLQIHHVNITELRIAKP
ncbi:MAG TPA: hypothetical protein VK909_24580 [Anaerolineales bacterium]|nr:hypothetical protein [Anaerolineales bacterium]